MMGYQHGLSGVAAWLAVSPAVDAAYGLTPGQVVLGTVITAGAAMVPDLDQHGSTIGRTYGPITNVLARLVGFLAGGHRNGTHSLLGVAAFTFLAWFASTAGGWVLAGVLWIVLGVALKTFGVGEAMKPARHGPLRALARLLNAAVMLGVTALVMHSPIDLHVPLVAGMAIGTAAHIAGDMLTPQGCPLFWLPGFVTKMVAALGKTGRTIASLSRDRQGIGLVTTGNRWSSPVVTTVLTVLVLWLLMPVPITDLVVALAA